MKLIKTLILLVLIQSCISKSSTDIDVFINKIETKEWDSNLNSFINKKCEIQTDYSISNKVKLKLKHFLKNRDVMLKVLSKEEKMLGAKIDTLIIKESYFDMSTFDSSFFIMNNLEKEGLVIYMKNNEIEKIEKLEESFYDDEFLNKEAECFNQIRGGVNSATFTTVFFLNESQNLVIETKSGYLGVMVD